MQPSTYFREYYIRNKNHILQNNRKNQELAYLNTPEKMLFKNAKSRAKKFGIEFSISVEDIVIPEKCPVLGVLMVRKTNTAPSLDRIDPSKGYISGNVQVMSKLANTMKNNATVKELQEFARWVKRTYKTL